MLLSKQGGLPWRSLTSSPVSRHFKKVDILFFIPPCFKSIPTGNVKDFVGRWKVCMDIFILDQLTQNSV